MRSAEMNFQRARCGARTCPAQLRTRGFTLLEVLAALVIVALGMLGVIEAVSQTARNSSYVREKTIAHWIAMNQLTLARLAQQAPKVDKSSDELEMGNRRWRWTMEVTQTPVESVRRIDVRVRPEDSEEGSSLASVTGFYGAALAPAGTTIVQWQGDPQDQTGGEDNDGKKDDDGKNEQPPDTPQPDPPEPTDPPMEDPPEEGAE
jgi:general secretion pathway protein I